MLLATVGDATNDGGRCYPRWPVVCCCKQWGRCYQRRSSVPHGVGGDAAMGFRSLLHGAGEGWLLMLQRAGGAAATAGSRCYKGRPLMLQRAGGAAATAGSRCYMEPAALLQRSAANATTGERHCYDGRAALLRRSAARAAVLPAGATCCKRQWAVLRTTDR